MSKSSERTAALIGEENVGRLFNSRVLVVGLGGVGGAATEVLARSGIGSLTLVDGDVFDVTNLNRQLLCTAKDVGKNKAQTAKERVLSLNGDITVVAVDEFFCAANSSAILDAGFDYCIDAIDDISAKTELIIMCKERGIPIVSAMGAGNRIDCDFCVTDLFKTKDDPFARAMRHRLKGKIDSLDTVCAMSAPLVKSGDPSSIAAPPIVMGAMLANHVVKSIIGL